MPLLNADFKALEWLGAAYLSKDKVAYEEIRNGVDQHSSNQERFGLPSRLIAKTFVFRLIYGGTAYAYANDADFASVGYTDKDWQDVIEKFYDKYKGIAAWHKSLMEQAMSSGAVTIPTGRRFQFRPDKRTKAWPRTTILNYPVQGFGADLMVLARLQTCKMLSAISSAILPVCTVHDSLVFDTPTQLVKQAATGIFSAWAAIPSLFEQCFGVALDLPCKVEVGVGPDWKHLTEIKENG